MSQWEALAIILLIMGLGDIVSKLTRGKVPSALVIVLCFVIGYWTILPGDLIGTSGISTGVYNICSYFLIANMATNIPVDEMKRQWKTIIVAVMAVLGICALGLTLGTLLFGKLLVFSTISGFAGGAGALMVIREVSERIGANEIVVMALICGNVQTLIGYPLTGVVLRREALRMEKLVDEGRLTALEAIEEKQRGWAPFIKFQKFSTSAVMLLKLGIVALLSYYLSKLTNGAVSGLIFALLLGFFGSLVGFLEPNILGKARADGFCFTFMLAYLFSLFSAVTPSLFITYFVKIFLLAIIVTVGMALAAWICSKVFKGDEFSFDMCMGIAFTCYHGFPVNVALTNEAINAAVEDPKKRQIIESHMMPKMLVGGFTSVTFVSVALANIIAPFLAALF